MPRPPPRQQRSTQKRGGTAPGQPPHRWRDVAVPEDDRARVREELSRLSAKRPPRPRRSRRPPREVARPLLDPAGSREEQEQEEEEEEEEESLPSTSSAAFFELGGDASHVPRRSWPPSLYIFWALFGFTLLAAFVLIAGMQQLPTRGQFRAGSARKQVGNILAYSVPPWAAEWLQGRNVSADDNGEFKTADAALARKHQMIMVAIISAGGALVLLQCVYMCRPSGCIGPCRGEGTCRLGVIPVEAADGGVRWLDTNRRIKPSRVLGWLGTMIMVTGICSTPFIVIGGLRSQVASMKLIEWLSLLFASLAIVLSLWEIQQHLRNYHRPKLQRHIVRVLMMVPVYATDGFVSVVFPGKPEMYMVAIRGCYEAYTIYSFYAFVLEYLQILAVQELISEEAEHAIDAASLVERGEYGLTGGGGGKGAEEPFDQMSTSMRSNTGSMRGSR
jgi:hypothetical protein